MKINVFSILFAIAVSLCFMLSTNTTDAFEVNPPFIKAYCDADYNCVSYEKCVDSQCQSACNDEESCGPNTVCYTENHVPKCDCLPDYVANPHGNGCVSFNSFQRTCYYNSDCASYEKCNRGKCIPACDEKSFCGPNTISKGDNHVCNCECLSGYVKHRYANGCIKPNEESGSRCTNANHCVFDENCIDGKCRNVCNECGLNTKCISTNHHSICTCLPGHFGKAYTQRGCIAFSKTCHEAANCEDDETCHNNKCMKSCDVFQCGKQTICTAKRHKRICECHKDFEGNPYNKGCLKPYFYK